MIDRLTIAQILESYPFAQDFLDQNRLNVSGSEHLTFAEFLKRIGADEIEDQALRIETLQDDLNLYIKQILDFLGVEESGAVRSLTILPGHEKDKTPESFERLDIYRSQIVSIVGPTGSGKSRLLADIEWAAQRDTPTGRAILINGEKPDPKWRYSSNNKLVAQLSQNMNFVMDLSVGEFIEMHAESRMIGNREEIKAKILAEANRLAGESFSASTPVTSLSGGQSRALMIADTATLSASPIVLIDEIENAGIDRRKALDLLVSQDKIVLMATHDPLLALMADRRIVIQNGGIRKIVETGAEEKALLLEFNQIDAIIQEARRKLRAGERLCEVDCKIGRKFPADARRFV